MATQKLVTIRGTITRDAFYFPLLVNEFEVQDMILDTGAFELTFTSQIATGMGLPNLGNLQIAGVGGQTNAYQSRCTLTFGSRTFQNVPCIVDPTLQAAGLFGLKFFIDNGLKLELDPAAGLLSILEPIVPSPVSPKTAKPLKPKAKAPVKPKSTTKKRSDPESQVAE